MRMEGSLGKPGGEGGGCGAPEESGVEGGGEGVEEGARLAGGGCTLGCAGGVGGGGESELLGPVGMSNLISAAVGGVSGCGRIDVGPGVGG